MVGRFLITTALEKCWRSDRPVLFLGEWCRLYDRKEAWEDLDAVVAPYHWNDRAKLHNDYLTLRYLYEELLGELAARLNAIHGVEHSLRYWRILVGPWLSDFLTVLFDRWSMLEQVTRDCAITGVKVQDGLPERVVPNDMETFSRMSVSDWWNEAIYGQLLRRWGQVPIETVVADATGQYTGGALPRAGLARRMKEKLAVGVSRASGLTARQDDAFFLATYLPAMQDLCLQWQMGQLPKRWRAVATPKVSVDWTRRQWELGNSRTQGFPAIARAMIPRQIPALYLEGYAVLRARCAALPWPARPRLIFTGTAQNADDLFKAWAAEKTEAGAPLVIGQHGGHYGVGLWSSSEDHEISICDSWLSWGESDGRVDRVVPTCNLRMVGQTMHWDPQGGLLMVEMTIPRYAYHMYSVPFASQWLDYFEDQCRFVAALPPKLHPKLQVRLYGLDYGWRQAERWRSRLQSVQLEEGRSSIKSLIARSRIFVCTYNATSFLESLSMNVPTIMFWNPAYWELRDSAVPCFDRLKAAGIFHDSPDAAAEQIVKVWNNVARWWNSEAVQSVRSEFCERYSRTSRYPHQLIGRALARSVRPPRAKVH